MRVQNYNSFFKQKFSYGCLCKKYQKLSKNQKRLVILGISTLAGVASFPFYKKNIYHFFKKENNQQPEDKTPISENTPKSNNKTDDKNISTIKQKVRNKNLPNECREKAIESLSTHDTPPEIAIEYIDALQELIKDSSLEPEWRYQAFCTLGIWGYEEPRMSKDSKQYLAQKMGSSPLLSFAFFLKGFIEGAPFEDCLEVAKHKINALKDLANSKLSTKQPYDIEPCCFLTIDSSKPEIARVVIQALGEIDKINLYWLHLSGSEPKEIMEGVLKIYEKISQKSNFSNQERKHLLRICIHREYDTSETKKIKNEVLNRLLPQDVEIQKLFGHESTNLNEEEAHRKANEILEERTYQEASQVLENSTRVVYDQTQDLPTKIRSLCTIWPPKYYPGKAVDLYIKTLKEMLDKESLEEDLKITALNRLSNIVVKHPSKYQKIIDIFIEIALSRTLPKKIINHAICKLYKMSTSICT